jgi:hypothetical protein
MYLFVVAHTSLRGTRKELVTLSRYSVHTKTPHQAFVIVILTRAVASEKFRLIVTIHLRFVINSDCLKLVLLNFN